MDGLDGRVWARDRHGADADEESRGRMDQCGDDGDEEQDYNN